MSKRTEETIALLHRLALQADAAVHWLRVSVDPYLPRWESPPDDPWKVLEDDPADQQPKLRPNWAWWIRLRGRMGR